MGKDYRQIVIQKNKDELKVICRKLNLTRFHKLSIGRLKSLVLENQSHPKFKKAIGIKPPFLLRGDVLLTLISISVSYFLFFLAKGDSKESTEVIKETVEEKFRPVEELTKTVKEIYKTDIEYTEYIKEQEELNNELLKNFFGNDFQVFGQRNNHLFKSSYNFNSRIYVEDDKLKLKLDFEEIDFGKGTIGTSKNSGFEFPLEQIKKGRLVLNYGFVIDNKVWGIVLLNNDYNNPIYAIGLVTIH